LTCCTLLLYILISLVIAPNVSEAGIERMPIVVTVYHGDSLWSIAAEYVGASEDIRDMVYKIQMENKLASSFITVGQTLVIPVD